MKILVIGSGGREHALAWKLAQSPRVSDVIVAPGNAGTATEAKCRNVAIKVTDIDGLLKLAQEKQVGVIGLKPFGAGTTFGIKPRQIQGRVDTRARVLVKEMLQEKRLSAIIPGVNIPEQLEENVHGSYEKDKPSTAADKQALHECLCNYQTHLTPDYQWLHEWHHV